MPSVEVSWRGICPSRQMQNEILSYLQQVAQRSEARWQKLYSDGLWPREEKETIRFFDQELSGHILVSTGIALQSEDLLTKAKQFGLKYEPRGHKLYDNEMKKINEMLEQIFGVRDEPIEPKPSDFYVWVNHAKIYGIEFLLFDPRAAMQDAWVSFNFIESEEAPFLNGHITEYWVRQHCVSSDYELISKADSLFQKPSITIRYVMEKFINKLLIFIKYFFIPGFHYWFGEDLLSYQESCRELDELVGREGIENAKKLYFDKLLELFEVEADWAIELRKASAG